MIPAYITNPLERSFDHGSHGPEMAWGLRHRLEGIMGCTTLRSVALVGIRPETARQVSLSATATDCNRLLETHQITLYGTNACITRMRVRSHTHTCIHVDIYVCICVYTSQYQWEDQLFIEARHEQPRKTHQDHCQFWIKGIQRLRGFPNGRAGFLCGLGSCLGGCSQRGSRPCTNQFLGVQS